LKILLLGSNGQLGKCLVDELSNTDYNLLATNRLQIDITDLDLTKRKIIEYSPNIVINASAYNAVNKAEEEFDLANMINNTAIENIAGACYQINAAFIHISSDYVFDGNSQTPYTESSLVNPLCVYGKSKLDGELSIKRTGCKHIIIRTAWVFSEYGNNFLKTMINLASTNNELDVVSDQYGCPTYARDLAIAIISTFSHIKNNQCKWGIYNFCGDKSCSWYEFAENIFDTARNLKLKSILKLNKISMNKYNNKAKRPKYSALNCSKFTKSFGIKPSNWKKGIIQALNKI